MKKNASILFFLSLISSLSSCDFFSKPLYTISRDTSAIIGSLSTGDLADNIDKFSTDSEKVTDVLNELASRNQEEIKELARDDKEKLLEASVGAILPTSQLGETVGMLTSTEGKKDYNKILDVLTKNSPDVSTKVLETVLKDEEVLKNTDAATIALGTASLIVNTVKKEGGDTTMETFQKAVSESTTNGTLNQDSLKKSLEKSGFSPESVSALATAVDAAHVLVGTAGEGKPDRRADIEKIKFGGYDLGGLLNDIKGGQ